MSQNDLAHLTDRQRTALDQHLLDAIVAQDADLLGLALRAGARIQDNSLVPCITHRAYSHYDRDIFNTLLDNGMDINQRDSDGDTVLYRAVGGFKFDIVQHCLDRKADIFIENFQGQSAVTIARYDSEQLKTNPKYAKMRDLVLSALPKVREGFDIAADKLQADKKLAADVPETQEPVKLMQKITPIMRKNNNPPDGFELN